MSFSKKVLPYKAASNLKKYVSVHILLSKIFQHKVHNKQNKVDWYICENHKIRALELLPVAA